MTDKQSERIHIPPQSNPVIINNWPNKLKYETNYSSSVGSFVAI